MVLGLDLFVDVLGRHETCEGTVLIPWAPCIPQWQCFWAKGSGPGTPTTTRGSRNSSAEAQRKLMKEERKNRNSMSTRKFAPLETEIWNLDLKPNRLAKPTRLAVLDWNLLVQKKTTRLAVLARNLQEKKHPRKRRSETEAVRRANAAGCVCSKPTKKNVPSDTEIRNRSGSQS